MSCSTSSSSSSLLSMRRAARSVSLSGGRKSWSRIVQRTTETTTTTRFIGKAGGAASRRGGATVMMNATMSTVIPAEVSEFIEPAAIEMAKRVEVIEVPVEGREKSVMTSLVQSKNKEASGEYHPFVLLHGFDSSCLEYRRLFPKLEENGAEAYALDLLGWGFTDGLDGGVGDYSPEAKCAHLYAWWKQNVNRPIVLAGASLGGAAAIEFASRYPEAVARLVLIDAQGFIDGIGPMGMLPTPIAKAGVDILRTKWLRSGANKMAYFDQKYATDDAQNVGRLHTLLPQWNDATLSFMRSGGFRVVEKIPKLKTKTMVLWGRGDKILEPENAERFEREIEDCELVWVEESGHVPHLEQPDFTCAQLLRFGKK